MAVAVDRDAVGLAVPGADRRLEVVDVVVHVDELGDPVGHLRGEALAADVALEGRAHLDDVEVDGAGGDRLLQAGVVVGLGEVDPVELGAGVGLPRLEEAAEQEVVLVLVVEPHEGQLDAGELALLHRRLGAAEAHLADLLPVGVGGRAGADAGDLRGSRRGGCPARAPARVRAPSAPPEASGEAGGAGGALAAGRGGWPAWPSGDGSRGFAWILPGTPGSGPRGQAAEARRIFRPVSPGAGHYEAGGRAVNSAGGCQRWAAARQRSIGGRRRRGRGRGRRRRWRASPRSRRRRGSPTAAGPGRGRGAAPARWPRRRRRGGR